MKTLLSANLSEKTVLLGDSAWAPPVFSFGEDLTLALRFLQDVGGDTVEPALDLRNFQAALGVTDARPESGEFALQIGPGAQTAANTTDALPYNCAPAALAAAINARPAVVAAYGSASARFEDGSWRLVFGTGGAQVPLTVVNNALWPVSFGRVGAYPVNAVWQHELRLLQAPLAFTDAQARVLPAPPTVTRVQAGGGEAGFSWNEVQSLYVPPDFRGTYTLRWGAYARTQELSVSDSADTIQAALIAAIGAPNVTVTNPQAFTARIEFVRDLAGTAQGLLAVEALNPPAGDVTFTLSFTRAELFAYLRRRETATLPLEVWLWTAEDDGTVTKQLAFSVPVTIRRPVVWPELALVPATDYLRPLSPKDYVPYSAESVLTGQQFFRAELGDGAAGSFTIAHGLATSYVWVWVRENASNGRQLVDGTDFTVRIVDANSVTVEALTGSPAANAWLATVVSAQTVGAFAAGLTVTIGQVTGLATELAAIGSTVAAIQALLPTTPAGTGAAGGSTLLTITIPELQEVFPGKSVAGAVPQPLGGLLPAIHQAVPGSITGALPPVSSSSGVFTNNTGAALLLPGGYGTKSSSLPAGGFAGCDGRRWYPLTRAGTTNSYFPRDFERELFFVEVSAQMLRAGTTLDLSAQLSLQLLQALTRAQYLLVVEHATVPSQATPATTAANLADLVWNPVPLLTQRIILGPVAVMHTFGVQLVRGASGLLAANKVLYGLTTAADSVPASADVALRARLIDFDTENSVPGPRGAVSYHLTGASANIHN